LACTAGDEPTPLSMFWFDWRMALNRVLSGGGVTTELRGVGATDLATGEGSATSEAMEVTDALCSLLANVGESEGDFGDPASNWFLMASKFLPENVRLTTVLRSLTDELSLVRPPPEVVVELVFLCSKMEILSEMGRFPADDDMLDYRPSACSQFSRSRLLGSLALGVTRHRVGHLPPRFRLPRSSTSTNPR